MPTNVKRISGWLCVLALIMVGLCILKVGIGNASDYFAFWSGVFFIIYLGKVSYA